MQDEERTKLSETASERYRKMYQQIKGGQVSEDDFVTQMLAWQKQFADLASYDGLTGLLNWQGFSTSLGEELDLLKRFNISGALLALDIDKFKQVNDTLGHLEGDRMLQLYAQVIKENTRTSDLQARAVQGRIGGDEFLVLLVGTDIQNARVVAERIRSGIIEAVKEAFPNLGRNQTVSIGITQVAENDSVTTLRDRADKALYQAKEERNKIIIFSNR